MNISELQNFFVPATRTHKFRINCDKLSTGIIGTVVEDSAVYCKSSSLPEMNVGTIDIPIRGRTYHFSGDRNFSDWSCTLYLDKDLKIHQNIIAWQEKYNASKSNAYGTDNGEVEVELLNHENKSVRKCKLVDAFPSKIGQIVLDSSSTELATVDLTFMFSYCEYAS